MSRPRDVHPSSVYIERDGPRLAVRSGIGHLEYDAATDTWGFGSVDDGYFVAEGGVLGIDEEAGTHDVRLVAVPGRIMIYGDS